MISFNISNFVLPAEDEDRGVSKIINGQEERTADDETSEKQNLD